MPSPPIDKCCGMFSPRHSFQNIFSICLPTGRSRTWTKDHESASSHPRKGILPITCLSGCNNPLNTQFIFFNYKLLLIEYFYYVIYCFLSCALTCLFNFYLNFLSSMSAPGTVSVILLCSYIIWCKIHKSISYLYTYHTSYLEKKLEYWTCIWKCGFRKVLQCFKGRVEDVGKTVWAHSIKKKNKTLSSASPPKPRLQSRDRPIYRRADISGRYLRFLSVSASADKRLLSSPIVFFPAFYYLSILFFKVQ